MEQRRRRYIVQGLAVSAVAIVVTWGLGEVLLRGVYLVRNSLVESIPLPYVVGDSYGPPPPWAEGVRVLEPDDALLWRNRAGVRRRYVDVFGPARADTDRVALHRRFLPSLPDSLERSPTWDIALNAQGFRTAEFEVTKPAGRFRVVCLGDSWTFGANVGQDQTYPARLQALVGEAFPAVDVEVLNLGVLGYTSFQGLELLRRRALALHPDVVVIAFAMNDASVAGFRDRDLLAAQPASPVRRVGQVLGRSEVFRLLRYAALSLRYTPASLAEQIKARDARDADPQTHAASAETYAGWEAWTRVPLPDYQRNLAEMIALVRRQGAIPILLFNELWAESPYRAAMARMARAEGVPFVDSQRLIARAKERMERELEQKLALVPPAARAEPGLGDDVEVVFRVEAGGQPVADALYIVGAHPALGDLVPNRVALHDDGTHGDQRAGDGVWSYAVRLRPGTRLSYVYTNSGQWGRWEGLDVPALRSLVVTGPGGRRVYRPIESFGKLSMQADAWHTDARGYELIAGAVVEALRQDARLARRLAGHASP